MNLSQHQVAAHHEAGHVVAAILRGATHLHDITARHDGTGFTGARFVAFDGPFFAFGGIWAEARVQWPSDIPIAAEDIDGQSFEDYIREVCFEQIDDFIAATSPDGFGMETPTGEDGPLWRRWAEELEAVLPVVRIIAEAILVDALINEGEVRDLITACRGFAPPLPRD